MQTVSAKASAQPQTCSFNLYDDDLAAKFGLVPQSSCAHKMVATQYKGPYKAFMKGKTCTKYKMCVITTATECEKASKDLVGYGDAKADVMVNPSKAAGCWYVWQLHLLKFNNLFAKQHVQAGDPVDVICKPCTYEQLAGAGNCAAKNKCDVTTAAECTAASKELLLEDHDPDVMDDGAKAPGCFYVPTLDKKKRLKFNKKIAGNTAKSGNAANNICKACPQIAPTTTVRMTSKLAGRCLLDCAKGYYRIGGTTSLELKCKAHPFKKYGKLNLDDIKCKSASFVFVPLLVIWRLGC